MKIGLAYDLKTAVEARPDAPDDEAEEYDPPDTINALASEIEGLGHQVVHLGGGNEFLRRIGSANVDLVFNIAEGKGTYRSREAQVPSVLEMLGIPYSGSDPLTLAISLDKPMAKQVVLSAGVSSPRYRIVRHLDDLHALAEHGLNFPVVVKPAFEGSSKGIRLTSKVDRREDLEEPVKTVLNAYRQPALIEEFVAGREITVGVVGNCPPRVIGVMEVVPRNGLDGNFMYTIEVKREWQHLVSYRCPPDLPDGCIKAIEQKALAVFKALQCRDVARVDFRIDKKHEPHFLEVNPLPGLSPVNSDLPLMASLSGWSYRLLVKEILEAALQRYAKAT